MIVWSLGLASKKPTVASRLPVPHGPEYAVLATRLRQARLDAGLSQTEAASRLQKPQSFISNCESGKRRLDFIEMKVVAELYGKELSFFDHNSEEARSE